MHVEPKRPCRRRSRPPRLVIFVVVLLSCAAVMPAVAAANTITSQNWSGYAAHRGGVKFKRVNTTWRQPSAACTGGQPTYSAFWVGIGGYSLKSNALEQIGSELDCNADGTESMSAWYELVPSPAHAVHMTIAGGDLITASVAIDGKRVSVRLTDDTRHETFAKTIVHHAIDMTSAEWIAEAPSDCTSNSCTTLPLADFNAVHFADASAQTTTGKTGGISSSLWGTTKILLGYSASGARFVADTTTANATPGTLLNGGRSFLVDYAGTTSTTSSGGAGPGGGGPGGGGPGGLAGSRRR